MSPSFLQSLAELVKLLPWLRELKTRGSYLEEAIVSNNKDKTGFRRIKATRESQGGQSETDWFPAGRATMFSDEPIPPVGAHVLLGFVNGDRHRPYLIRTLSNATNPPDEGQLDPIKDNTIRIPGNQRHLVEGNTYEETQGEKEEIVGESCYLTVKGKKLKIDATVGQILINALNPGVGQIRVESDILSSVQSNVDTQIGSKVATLVSSLVDVLITAGESVRIAQGGAYVEMRNGAWDFGSESGQSWSFGDGEWVWDCAGNSIRVINCTGFSINGTSNQVAVVGAPDTDGDLLTDRGY